MASVNLEEKGNFTRLGRLFVDKGTEALRNTLDTIYSSSNLPAVLDANKKSLLKLKFKDINDHQWNLLFPPSNNAPDSNTFDVTLLIIVLQNICDLNPPATGWNTMPPDTANSLEANVTRIKLFINQFYTHLSSTQVDNTTCEHLWQKVSQVLVALKIPKEEIHNLKSCSVDSEEEMLLQSLKKWCVGPQKQSDLQQEDDREILKTSMQQSTPITEEKHSLKKKKRGKAKL